MKISRGRGELIRVGKWRFHRKSVVASCGAWFVAKCPGYTLGGSVKVVGQGVKVGRTLCGKADHFVSTNGRRRQ